MRGSWRLDKDCNILTPALMFVSVVSFSFFRAAQPEGPGAQLSTGWWLSLLHLITNSTYLQLVSKTPSGVPKALSAGCGFPYHILSLTSLNSNSSGAPRAPSAGLSLQHLISNFSGPQLSDFRSSQSYIIVQRPLNLRNGLFDRHQA